MASEASVTDQTVSEPIQDAKEVNGLKNDEVTVSEAKDATGTEDKVKVEDATVAATVTPVQKELKQQESETQVPEDTKEAATDDDKSASESSAHNETQTNLSVALESEVVGVAKEEAKQTAESVEKKVEDETSLPDTQETVTDQVEEVTKEETKVNETAVEPVESVVKEVEDPANLPVSRDVEVTKEEANDSKPDLDPTVESSEKQVETELVSPPTQDSDTRSVEVTEEEAKDSEAALEPEVGNTNNSSGTQQNDTQVTEEEIKGDDDQESESLVGTKVSGTPEASNETVEKSADVDKDTVQEPETQIHEESAAPEVVSEVKSELPEVASESVAERKAVEPIQMPTDDVSTVSDGAETTPLSQDEKTTDDEVQIKFEQSNEVPLSNDSPELATEDAKSELQQTTESDSLVAGHPGEVVSEPKDAVETVVSDILTTKQDDDSIVGSDTKESEHAKDTSSADITVTGSEALPEPELESGKKDEEDPVEVEKPTLPETSEVTTEAENATITGTIDNIPENDTAKDREAKNSAVPEAEAEKKDETSESTSQDVDVAAVENKASTSVSEADASGAEPKQAEAKQTLLDKFASEASEDKQELETVNIVERSPDETTKDGDDTKADVEVQKQDAPAKTSQRQSSNIISKVKKSFVKVKKAIIGKSPSSKTTASESKDTTNA